MELIETGKIVATHGLKGELRIEVWGDSPEFLLPFDELYLEGGEALEVVASRVHRGCLSVRFEGIDSLEAAMPLINRVLYIDRGDIELPEDVYLIRDLMGLTVVDADTGEEYGKIDYIQQSGGRDVYQIAAKNGKKLMFPAIPEIIESVNIGAGRMTIRPLPGLFDL